MRNYVLLTGATGLLGQYLVRDFLQDGHRIAVLVRGTKARTPEQRVEQTMQMWERQLKHPLPRPVVIPGDITQEDLGLSPEDREWIEDNCTTMLHCAASLTFHEHNGEPWRTNIEGTRNVLRLCTSAGLREMHYISTAYVCGHRHDLVMEDELDVGQEFRNDYEKSKFTAEKLVRECAAFESLTVYRPVVITGDSQTGYTSTYHGTYLYMKLASVLQQNTEPNEKGEYYVPVRWGLTGEERRNITPVDWNSAVISRLFNNPEAYGRTYHLAPTDPITMREAISYASDHYGLTGIEFRGFGTKPDTPLNEMERWLWSNISIYGSYDFMDPQFDRTNLDKFAPIPCPKLDRKLALKLMKYAEDDRWGKRKPPKLELPELDISALLASCCDAQSPTKGPEIVGLQVTGCGGGDWTLHLDKDRLTHVVRGLPSPDRSAVVFRLACADLARIHMHSENPVNDFTAICGNQLGKQLAANLARALMTQVIQN